MPFARRLACMLSEKTGEFNTNFALQTHAQTISFCKYIQTVSDPLFVHSRYIVLPKDFEAGYKNNIKKDESEHEFYK